MRDHVRAAADSSGHAVQPQYPRHGAVSERLSGIVLSAPAGPVRPCHQPRGLDEHVQAQRRPFAAKADAAKTLLRQADIVASDERGVRIEGANSYHWVFRCDKAVVHTPDFTRAASVVHAMMDGHRPQVWISDRYSAQQNHAPQH
jgi:hypothetical protein